MLWICFERAYVVARAIYRADMSPSRNESLSDELQAGNAMTETLPCGPKRCTVLPPRLSLNAATMPRPRPGLARREALPLSLMQHSTIGPERENATRMLPG